MEIYTGAMRGLGYFSLDSVDYAIYESNGKLSAVQSENTGEYSPSSLPILLVKGGKPFEKNLQIASLSVNDVISIANKEGISRLKNVDVLTIDGDGKYYIQQDGREYKTGNFALKGGTKW